MAKLSLELKDFSGGTITNADPADIPLGAASYSLNCTPTGALGQIEPINTDIEVMTGVPPITGMVVRDGLDAGDNHLGVNIGELFIYIPNYENETKLGDFVEIASRGQLFYGSTPDDINITVDSHFPGGNTAGRWNKHNDGTRDIMFTVIPTIPGYIYSFEGVWEAVDSLGASVDGSLPEVDAAKVSFNTASFNDENEVLPYDSISHLDSSLTALGETVWYQKGVRQWYFTAEKEYSVVAIQASSDSLSYSNSFKKLRCEFSKGGFLWNFLGENLDFTDTDKGLFIGSKTTRPHILHHSKDDKGRILDYLTTSECEPLISATSLANIDYMDIVKGHDGTADVDYLISGVYGEKNIWILQRDHDSTLAGGTDYTTFFQSEPLGFASAKGVGGILADKDANHIGANARSFFLWEQEGFNIWKCNLSSEALDPAVPTVFDVNLEKTYNIDINIFPSDGYISSVVQSEERDDILYVLFTKEGGFTGDDNVIIEIDTSESGTKQLSDNTAKVLYKVLPYTSVTAYSGHSYKKNWLGFKTDVNPKSSKTWYWSKVSSSKANPIKYKNGGYADLTLRTGYGNIKDMCWANSNSDDICLDVEEQAFTCHSIADGGGTTMDLLTFSIKPLGDSIFVENSGIWRKAEQWPNWWPDGDDPDGYWTNIHTNQKTTSSAFLVSLIPEQLTDVTESYVALTGDINPKIENLRSRMTSLDSYPAAPYTEWPDLNLPELNAVEALLVPTVGIILPLIDNILESLIRLATLQNNPKYTDLKNAIDSEQSNIIIINKAHSLLSSFNGNLPSYMQYTLFGQAPKLLALEYWDYLFKFNNMFFGNITPELMNWFEALRSFWGQLNVVGAIDTSVTVDAYSSKIKHRKIGSSFPIEGGFSSLEKRDVNSFYATQIESGNIQITTGTFTFPVSGTASEKLANSSLSFSDTVGHALATGNVKNGQDVFTIKEWQYETVQDGSGNIVRTRTTEQAPITEACLKPVAGPLILNNADVSGSNMELIASGQDGFIVGYYNGDLLLRSFQEDFTGTTVTEGGEAVLVDWKASPFNSGDLSVGITPSDGPSAQEFETDAEGATTTEKYTSNFELNSTVYYNMSFLYDGYQEGPLMNSAVTHQVNQTHGCDSLNLTVNVGTSSPRITAVNVYRKNDTREKYRLVEQIEIDNEWQTQEITDGVEDANLAATAFMQAGITTQIVDDGKKGISYEALTGMPETLTNTMVDYAESEEMSGYLFVCNARHKDIDNAEKYIFRSQVGKFSIFNWAQDYIGLPERVHTLKACYNRLFAFSNKTMYQIDPHSMIVEQIHEGFGISGAKSVTVVDGVMYLCNKNGVYMFGGGKFKIISQTIQDIWDDIMINLYPACVPILINDKKYNTLTIFFDNAGTYSADETPTTAFAFSIDKRRWDIWEVPQRIKSACIDNNNNVIVSGASSAVASYDEEGNPLDSEGAEIGINSHSIWQLHTGSSKKTIKWKTKELTMDQDTRDKKFKRVKIVGSNVYVSKVIIDNTETCFNKLGNILTYDDQTGEWNAGSETYLKTDTTVNYLNLMKLPKEITIKGKKIQVEVDTMPESIADTSILQNLTVIYNWRTLK